MNREPNSETIGELSATEIDTVLRRQRIGRIAATAVGHLHVTPIVYGYDGEAIYGHLRFGRKIQYVRGNPEVGLEVEEVVDPTAWRVVLLTCPDEELKDATDRDRAMRLVLAQAGGGPQSEAVRVERPRELIVSRPRILERAGRFEHVVSVVGEDRNAEGKLAVLDLAARTAKLLRGEVHLVTVIPPEDERETFLPADHDRPVRLADSTGQRLPTLDEPELRGPAAIVQYAADHQVDVIAMATHGRAPHDRDRCRRAVRNGWEQR